MSKCAMINKGMLEHSTDRLYYDMICLLMACDMVHDKHASNMLLFIILMNFPEQLTKACHLT